MDYQRVIPAVRKVYSCEPSAPIRIGEAQSFTLRTVAAASIRPTRAITNAPDKGFATFDSIVILGENCLVRSIDARDIDNVTDRWPNIYRGRTVVVTGRYSGLVPRHFSRGVPFTLKVMFQGAT